MIRLNSYFDRNEIKCPCCGQIEIDKEFLEMMFMLRILQRESIVVNSWCRCAKHNKAVGSSSINHIMGKAADIRCINGYRAMTLLKNIFKVGFRRIGVHETFIHVDSMTLPPSLWTYKK